LKPLHFVEALTAELVDGGGDGEAVVAHERRLEDRVLREEGVLVAAELRTDVVDVGDELTLHLVGLRRRSGSERWRFGSRTFFSYSLEYRRYTDDTLTARSCRAITRRSL
jgi:hypothetical protein